MAEKRALCGHGERKMNLSHWNIITGIDVSSEDSITELEHEREVIQVADDIFYFSHTKKK